MSSFLSFTGNSSTKTFLALLIFISSQSTFGQKWEYTFKNPRDSSFNCYLAIIPDSMEVRGLIVRDYSSLPKRAGQASSPYKWRDLALREGLAVVYTLTSNFFPELYYSDSSLVLLDNLIHEAVVKYNIPRQNIFMGGISASGTRALKYAQFCEMGKSRHNIRIRGVFSVDSPLDFERFYYSAVEHKDNFSGGMLWEAKLMPGVFKSKFGGTPDENPEIYRKHSVFSYKDPAGGNAKYLMNTPVIFFHEPDIDWWIEERGAVYYDINSYDIAGLYNYLKLHGHKDAEMITTTGKGYDKEGVRKCHSWSIVDEEYLINWITARIENR